MAASVRARARAAGPTLLVISSLLFGVMALLVKQASARLPGAEVAFARFAVGLAAVLATVAAGVRLRPVNFRGLFLRGVFGSIAVLLYFAAISRLPVGTATLLTYTAPVFTALFASLFLGERVTVATAIALFAALLGVALVIVGRAPQGRLGLGLGLGEICGLASAVFSGAAVTTIRAVRRSDGSWEIFAAFCLVGVACTAPWALSAWVAPTAREWIVLVAVGLVSVLAQGLFIFALRYVAAATSGVISQLTPATALLLGVVLFDDPLSGLMLGGAAITLGAVAWSARSTESPRT